MPGQFCRPHTSCLGYSLSLQVVMPGVFASSLLWVIRFVLRNYEIHYDVRKENIRTKTKLLNHSHFRHWYFSSSYYPAVSWSRDGKCWCISEMVILCANPTLLFWTRTLPNSYQLSKQGNMRTYSKKRAKSSLFGV